MPTDTFRASVQYGDWTGTAAADNADQRDLSDFLATKKIFDRDKEFLIAASLWIGENHGGKIQSPCVTAIITLLDSTYDNVYLRQCFQKAQSRTRTNSRAAS
jgi:hypothetical protein